MLNQTLTSKTLENSIPENVFLVAGGRDSSAPYVFDSSDAFIAKRISKDSIAKVIKRKDWIYGVVYEPWTSEIDSSKNYYALNTNNDVVYVCIKNNPNGRVDQTGVYLSTQEPTHSLGIQSYSDGYTWLALFKLDPTQALFLTSTEIPIPNFIINKRYSNLSSQYNLDCGSGVTAFGTCCLYYKNTFKDPFSGVTYTAGSLTDHTLFSTCYQCTDIAKKLNKQKVFISGVTAGGITGSHTINNPLCGATIAVETLITNLTNNLDYITTNSSSRFQYDLITNHETIKRGILAATINLEDLTTTQKRITTSNPSIIVADPQGSGADIQLLTTQISHGVHEIYGIKVNNPGSGYVLPSFSIEGYSSSELNDVINLYVYPDNLFEEPTKIIPSISVVIRSELTEQEIRSTIINNRLTKLALITSPIDLTTEAENIYAEGDSTVYSMQTSVLAKAVDVAEMPGILPPTGTPIIVTPENAEIENVTKNSYKAYVSAIKNTDGKIYDGSFWVTGWELAVNDVSGAFAVNDEVLIQGITHTIISVTEPQLDREVEYFSVTSTNIELPEIPTNRSYSTVIRVNT